MKDTQKSRVYEAEGTIFSEDGPQKHLRTVGQLQDWADKFLERSFVRSNFDPVKVEILPGRGCKVASCVHYEGDNIRAVYMPLWARTEETLLHELAHAVHSWDEKHGEQWCGTFIYFVEKVLGREIADQVRAEFNKRDVRFTFNHIRNW